MFKFKLVGQATEVSTKGSSLCITRDSAETDDFNLTLEHILEQVNANRIGIIGLSSSDEFLDVLRGYGRIWYLGNSKGHHVVGATRSEESATITPLEQVTLLLEGRKASGDTKPTVLFLVDVLEDYKEGAPSFNRLEELLISAKASGVFVVSAEKECNIPDDYTGNFDDDLFKLAPEYLAKEVDPSVIKPSKSIWAFSTDDMLDEHFLVEIPQ